MYLLLWLIVCIVAGWLTGLIMKGRGYGLVGDLLLGIVGGWLGGFLLGRIFLGGGLIGGIFVRMVGAILLVALVRMLRRA